jgi:hypothetical protein
MKKTFKASRLVGLLALALGLMAFGATAAQAEPGAFWEVNGSKLGGSESVQAKNDSPDSTLLTTVGTSKVEILCTTISFVGATISGTGASGKIHYVGCTTLLNGVAAGRCTPKSPGASLGLIETNALKGLIVLHETTEVIGEDEIEGKKVKLFKKVDLLELAPVTGTAFATLELGTLCAIGNKFDITGKAFLKDCKEEGLVNLKEHLFEEGPLSALLFGGNAATIDGSAWGFLSGANEGKTFSGHPA